MVTLMSVTDCGSGGGGDSASATPPQPAYINGTTTGQYTNNDVGFYLGASTIPATVTSTTVNPKLPWTWLLLHMNRTPITSK